VNVRFRSKGGDYALLRTIPLVRGTRVTFASKIATLKAWSAASWSLMISALRTDPANADRDRSTINRGRLSKTDRTHPIASVSIQ
jgi:hypothetical protein